MEAKTEVKRSNEPLVASNPANEPPKRVRGPRVSMAMQRQRLQVPDMPGYYLHWFKDENIPAAMDAYYEFVKRDELTMNPLGIGGSAEGGGNTDLGTNVSIIAGQNAAGMPVRLTLMKLPMEYHTEDSQMVAQRNGTIMEAIFGEEAKMFTQGGLEETGGTTYRKTALFNRPKRKAGKPGSGSKALLERLARLEKMADKK